MKTENMRRVLAAILTMTAFSGTARAQQAPPSPPPPSKLVTFRVDVTLARMEGATVLGSSPFSLLVNTGGSNRASDNTGRASLRIGIEVPSGSQTRTSSSTGTTTTDTVFKNVGTQIDAYVSAFDESRYAVDVSISDTSVFSDGAASEAIQQAQVRRNTALRSLARQEDLFRKNLITKDQLSHAQAEVADATTMLANAEKRTKSLAHVDQLAFRSFTSSNRVYLRDGESQEMTVATDRTSGETVRASVKLTVVK
jgi:hypothetical protein